MKGKLEIATIRVFNEYQRSGFPKHMSEASRSYFKKWLDKKLSRKKEK